MAAAGGAGNAATSGNPYVPAEVAAAWSHERYQTFTLTYFNIYARAETARLLFAYAGVPFKDDRCGRAEVAALRAEGKLPFSQIPVLQVDLKDGSSVRFAQSGAIARFVAGLSDMLPADELEAAQAQALWEGADELADANAAVHIFRWSDAHKDKFEQRKASVLAKAAVKLPCYNRLLTGRGGPFMLGAKPCYGDVHLDMICGQLLELEPTLLDGDECAALRALRTAIRELPRLKEAYTARDGPGVLEPRTGM